VSATPGNTSAVASFSPPESDGNSPITVTRLTNGDSGVLTEPAIIVAQAAKELLSLKGVNSFVQDVDYRRLPRLPRLRNRLQSLGVGSTDLVRWSYPQRPYHSVDEM
jgi:hypothetical protein